MRQERVDLETWNRVFGGAALLHDADRIDDDLRLEFGEYAHGLSAADVDAVEGVGSVE